MGFIKLKTFYTAKETINQVKKEVTEAEKAFTAYICDRCLIFGIYQELHKLKEVSTQYINR